MSKGVKWAIGVAGALVICVGLFRLFVTSVGSEGREAKVEAAGVIVEAPPGFDVAPAGEMRPAEAAAALADRAARAPNLRKLGIDYRKSDGSRVLLLLDRDADQVDERLAGANGTRVQTVWHQRALDRLGGARKTGDLSVPGLPPGEKKNLYH